MINHNIACGSRAVVLLAGNNRDRLFVSRGPGRLLQSLDRKQLARPLSDHPYSPSRAATRFPAAVFLGATSVVP